MCQGFKGFILENYIFVEKFSIKAALMYYYIEREIPFIWIIFKNLYSISNNNDAMPFKPENFKLLMCNLGH